MKKPNKQINKIRQRKSLKQAKKAKGRKTKRQESLNHRQNIIAAKKEELFNKWVAAVNTHFDNVK